ncbi:DEAD/DEAH box helicase [Isoptericola sp. b515]|uniref:DEAD/DEAH box helicase n=1 Tax=Isoptericola sp. b515 TaxID=3064652 RepID=UPI0027135BAE|nr:DEAD/DEAH box helicase [Isoptericola sp. b515]MDO8148736.1 DEAD/DEAH box helicase [Isoptericola sp. b515]
MNKQERRQLAATVAEVSALAGRDEAIRADRGALATAGQQAVQHLRAIAIDVPREGRSAWSVLPLGQPEQAHLEALAAATALPPISETEARSLAHLSESVPTAIRDARAVLGARRFLSTRMKKEAAAKAASYLAQYATWAREAGVLQLLDRIAPNEGAGRAVTLQDALSDVVGLRAHLEHLGRPELIDSQPIRGLLDAINAIDRAVKDEDGFRKAAIEAGTRVRRAETRKLLAGMPVERIKEATRDRLRITPLTDAGLTTVLKLLDYRYPLEALQGIGETTATNIRGAAYTLEQATYDEMPMRIDINNRTTEASEFLRRLGAWDVARRLKNADSDLLRAQELTDLAHSVNQGHSHLIVASRTVHGAQELLAGVSAVIARAEGLSTAKTADAVATTDPWDDFMSRPADYFGMLTELGFVTEDETKTHGDLPDEIVEAVRAMSLNTEHLRVTSLRGYQSFGSRFALVQRKVILGDEMGLGKTIEALAVLAHLRAQGHNYALAICPAAVVTNWVREISSKSTLRAHRVHGPGRAGAMANWFRNGGVAVTTFETLAWLLPHVDTVTDLACVVVDEAHYIKNPAAKRSINASTIMKRTERAILLTGTPLENRLEEFANLVGYLQPNLVVDTSGLSPRKFRQQVAPAYLRRNQEDVLTELPALVEVDENIPFSSDDYVAYRDAVAQGNFMAMRQAALTQGHRSAKMNRLLEIVQEAEDNGRRVIVFSHFRQVLHQVTEMLPGRVFGPLTGSVAAVARQRMVDEFTEAPHGAVLVSQIVAGGVGLNIQAASVVVLCEPQVKPTTEWQAIARARRMGQLETVQVHRLLSEEGVDKRVTEILARKKALFDDFARVSATADSAPEAFDISEAELAREVVASERERLFSQPPTNASSEMAR